MEQRFDYSAKRVNIVLSFVLGIPMIAGAAYLLATGGQLARRGTVFSPEASMIILTLVLLLGVVLLLFGIRLVAAGRRQVVITPNHVELPASASSRRIETVPFDAISNVVVQNDPIHGTVLTVVLSSRKSLKLAKNSFESAAAFEACAAAIEGSWHATHQ